MSTQKKLPGRPGWRPVLVGAVIVASIAAGTLVKADSGAVMHAKDMGTAFSEIATACAPAVVFIRTEKMVTMNPAGGSGTPDAFGGDLFERFFGHGFSMPTPERHMSAQGSGFIVSEDGTILTNNHVVDGAEEVTVRLGDGREFSAKVVGTDPHTDIAVLHIDAENLPTLTFGDSDDLEVGEWVLALGNPFGLSNTLTAGIVSAKGRSRLGITDYEDFIQTDAAINPGNSGGPLIDLDGKVVGINTAIASRTGSYMGIGFAIPISLAMEIEGQILDHGSVTRGYLGVVIQDLSADLATSLGVKDSKGVLVSDVEADSPADLAGLKAGDVIVELDGRSVEKVEQLRNQVARLTPGSKSDLVYLRDGHRDHASIEIGKKASDDTASWASGESGGGDLLGMSVEKLTGELAEQLDLVGHQGVVVTGVAPESPADRAHLQAGMLIEEVDRKPVSTVDELRKAINASGGDSVLLLVRDDRAAHFVVVQKKSK